MKSSSAAKGTRFDFHWKRGRICRCATFSGASAFGERTRAAAGFDGAPRPAIGRRRALDRAAGRADAALLRCSPRGILRGRRLRCRPSVACAPSRLADCFVGEDGHGCVLTSCDGEAVGAFVLGDAQHFRRRGRCRRRTRRQPSSSSVLMPSRRRGFPDLHARSAAQQDRRGSALLIVINSKIARRPVKPVMRHFRQPTAR